MKKEITQIQKHIALLVCLCAVSFVPVLLVPLIEKISNPELPFYLRYLVASLSPVSLAILFSMAGTIHKGRSGYGMIGIIKFSSIYFVAQYLITVFGLLAIKELIGVSTSTPIFALSIIFLNSLIFALLVEPFLGFRLSSTASFLIAIITTVGFIFCILYKMSWFWRFSFLGITTAIAIVHNLTNSSKGAPRQAATLN